MGVGLTAANVDTDVHVLGGVFDAVVVEGDVGLEQFVGGVFVGFVFFPAVEKLIGTEV